MLRHVSVPSIGVGDRWGLLVLHVVQQWGENPPRLPQLITVPGKGYVYTVKRLLTDQTHTRDKVTQVKSNVSVGILEQETKPLPASPYFLPQKTMINITPLICYSGLHSLKHN